MRLEKEPACMNDGKEFFLMIQAVSAEHGSAAEIWHRAQLIQHKLLETVPALAARYLRFPASHVRHYRSGIDRQKKEYAQTSDQILQTPDVSLS
jgi:hypothetical protein